MNRDRLRKIIRWIIVLFILLICFSSIIGAFFWGLIYTTNPIYKLPQTLLQIFWLTALCFPFIIWVISPFYATVRIFFFFFIFPDGKTFSEQLWKWIGCMRKPSLSFKIFSVIYLLILLANLIIAAFMVCLYVYTFIFLDELSINPFTITISCLLAIPLLGISYTAFVIMKKLYIEFRLIKPETEPSQSDSDAN